MKQGKDATDAFSALILAAGAGGGGMENIVEAGPVAIMYSLSRPGVIGSSANASGSSILLLSATTGALVVAFPETGVVDVFQLALVTKSPPCLKWWALAASRGWLASQLPHAISSGNISMSSG